MGTFAKILVALSALALAVLLLVVMGGDRAMYSLSGTSLLTLLVLVLMAAGIYASITWGWSRAPVASDNGLTRVYDAVHLGHPEYPKPTNVAQVEHVMERYKAADEDWLQKYRTSSHGVRVAVAAAGNMTRISQALGFIETVLRNHKNDVHEARSTSSMNKGDKTRLEAEVTRLKADLSASTTRVDALVRRLKRVEDDDIANTTRLRNLVSATHELLDAAKPGKSPKSLAEASAKVTAATAELQKSEDRYEKLMELLKVAVTPPAKSQGNQGQGNNSNRQRGSNPQDPAQAT